MDPVLALSLVLTLVASTTALGLWWRARTGRVVTVATDAKSRGHQVSPADLASTASFGERATLLQFSTEFCARCPAARVLLAQIASEHLGVSHLDVDLTHRADLARRFDILQTPTTFILDATGLVRARVGGAPHSRVVSAHLETIAGFGAADGNRHVTAA